jgi:hypothetical protein
MNYYAKAINYLQQDLDWRSLCFELASGHPKAFCDAADKVSPVPLTPDTFQAHPPSISSWNPGENC